MLWLTKKAESQKPRNIPIKMGKPNIRNSTFACFFDIFQMSHFPTIARHVATALEFNILRVGHFDYALRWKKNDLWPCIFCLLIHSRHLKFAALRQISNRKGSYMKNVLLILNQRLIVAIL